MQWNYTFGGSGDEYATDMLIVGNAIFFAGTSIGATGDIDIIVGRLGSSGVLNWSKRWNGEGDCYGGYLTFSSTPSAETLYVLCSSETPDRRLVILSYSSFGDKLDQKGYEKPGANVFG